MQANPSHFDDLDIFIGLGYAEKKALAGRFDYRLVRGGERLIGQGDLANHLHIVLSGRFAVAREGGPPIAIIARGEPVGEIAFFNGGTRTANVTALRDSEVLSIARSDFDDLANAEPMLWRSTVMALANRLVETTDLHGSDLKEAPPPRTLILCPAGDAPVSQDFAFELVRAMEELGTKAALLDENTARSGSGGAALNSPEMNRWLAVQEAAHDLVVWFAPNEATEWAEKAIRQADAALLVGAENPSSLGPIEKLVFERLAPSDIRLATLNERTSEWLSHRTIAGHQRAKTEAQVAALARFLCGRARGLVLGGGGALCGAQVALVFAMREAGLDFDSFAGTSAGAAVAAALAMNLDRAEIISSVKDIFMTNKALKRWTVPKFGFIDPTIVDRMLKQHYGTGMLEDLPNPFFAIATDLADNAEHVMERGPLWEAIRASCSVPILLPPMIDSEGRILVDGGITNNLPVDPMRRRKRGPNAAIMLGQSRWRRAEYRYDDYPSRGELLREKISFRKRGRLKAPRIGQILTRSMLLASDAASADALTRTEAVFIPPLPKGMGITDWHRFEALERDSYDWAQREIERRLNDDPSAFDLFR